MEEAGRKAAAMKPDHHRQLGPGSMDWVHTLRYWQFSSLGQ